uniref:Mediator of RNA polymerase II transcription subunit 28 n=1 Tax=Timema cristinae TaxID=61476 RepID=A0A7R9CJU4_TIMCR|nr:unnamed protein product [Timema cristinae]
MNHAALERLLQSLLYSYATGCESDKRSCLNVLTKEEALSTMEKDEIRVEVDHTILRFIDLARQMEAFFLQKRFLLSALKPELVVKELKVSCVVFVGLLKAGYTGILQCSKFCLMGLNRLLVLMSGQPQALVSTFVSQFPWTIRESPVRVCGPVWTLCEPGVDQRVQCVNQRVQYLCGACQSSVYGTGTCGGVPALECQWLRVVGVPLAPWSLLSRPCSSSSRRQEVLAGLPSLHKALAGCCRDPWPTWRRQRATLGCRRVAGDAGVGGGGVEAGGELAAVDVPHWSTGLPPENPSHFPLV